MKKNILFASFAVATALPIIEPAVAAAQDTSSYSRDTEENARIAEAYFDAYLSMDWDRLEQMLADDAYFSDPTGKPVFGEVLHEGKEEMMRLFHENYAPISGLAFDPEGVLHSGAHSAFKGNLTWTLTLQGGGTVTSTMPTITILEIENGLVIAHTDYADYRPFLEALAAVRNSAP